MAARSTDTAPTGEKWRYEPKWDGFRAIAEVNSAARVWSRSERPLHTKFPEIVAALEEHMPAGTTLDGEIVHWAREGRLDFDALLRRNRSGKAAARRLAVEESSHYIIFDLLRIDDRDLTRRALRHRRTELERLMRDVPQPSPLMLGWQTADVDEALDWFSGMADIGVEGLVIKDAGQSYRPGRRDWLKYKRRLTTEAIVGGYIGYYPRQLVLGRRDSRDGRLFIAGRTVDIDARQREEILDHARATKDHPWPPTLPRMWGSRERIDYTRVEPTLVVEVSPDTAVSQGRWRHPIRLVRLRPDLTPADVPHDLDLEA